MASFEFELPAVQGIQAGRPYYLTACPLRLLSRLFPENEDASPSGRQPHPALNRARVPEIARYVTGNPRSYVFGALTASRKILYVQALPGLLGLILVLVSR